MDMLTMTLQMALDKLIKADNAVERDEHDREAAVNAVIDILRTMKAEQMPEPQRMMA
jgi:hypothetical protein